MAGLPAGIEPTTFASISFHDRQTLAGQAETFEVDIAVEECLPHGGKVLEGVPWGASAWTTTSKLRVQHEDGTEKSYFMKTAEERGAVMMEGELNSLNTIDKVIPGFTPQVYGWGKFQKSETYFLIMDFIDLKMVLPDPHKFCEILVDMHQKSESPTGKFGFHIPTCHGKHIQPNDWDESWCRYFTRLITIFFEVDLEINGPWAEYEEAFQVLKTEVIPRLLEPLQSEGRILKPSLVHGDLWEENTGINVDTGKLIVFDASVFYAHNEYDLGMWRPDWNRIGASHFKQYLRRCPPSEPAHEWDDRNLLYSTKFNLAHSSGWTGSNATREKILSDMRYLNQKYSQRAANEKAVAQNQEAFTKNQDAFRMNQEAFGRNQGLPQTVPAVSGEDLSGNTKKETSKDPHVVPT